MRAPQEAVKRATSGAAVLAGNDQALVAVTATAFDDGVAFDLTAILAPGVAAPDRDQFVCDDFRPPATLPQGFLRFGVVDAEGRLTTNLPGQRWVAQLSPPPR